MKAARLAARCAELLGTVDGPVVVAAGGKLATALAACVQAAADETSAAGAVCVFLGERATPAPRRDRLRALSTRLLPGAPLVVVDHNQPRRRWGRMLGTLALAVRGHGPSRARYGVAREVQAVGFTVERLRLAAGERIQLVVARRAATE